MISGLWLDCKKTTLRLFPKKGGKSDSPCWFGAFKTNPYIFCEPKTEDLVWRPKSISPYENFLNWSTEREKKKKPRSRQLFIFHKPQQVLKEEKKQSVTCTKTITKPNSSNFHNPSTRIGLKQILTWHKIYIIYSKPHTSDYILIYTT